MANGTNGGLAGNYSLVAGQTAAASITPRLLTAGYAGVDKGYDATVAASVITTDNRVGADVLTINRTANFTDANAGVGKTINVAAVSLAGADAGNYTVASTGSATATITARGITITANNASKVYGASDPSLIFSVGGAGLAGADTITSVFAGALARAPGESVTASPYAISQGTLAANANYSVGYTPGQLAITPRALTITADNKSKVAGDPLPPFTASFNGFAFADTASSLNGTLAFATPATASSAAGSYAITPSGLSSANYSVAYANGLLSVTPAAPPTPPVVAPVTVTGPSTAQTPGTSVALAEVRATINSRQDMTLPLILSGPPDVQTNFVGLQPGLPSDGVLNRGSGNSAVPNFGDVRRIPSAALESVVSIVNGGLALPPDVALPGGLKE